MKYIVIISLVVLLALASCKKTKKRNTYTYLEATRAKSMDRRMERPVSIKDCKDEEPFPNRNDCHKFFQCMKAKDGTWILTRGTCDNASHYDRHKNTCVSGKDCKNPPHKHNNNNKDDD